MALVLDYSAGMPGAAAIQAAAVDGQDVIGAVRYIGFPTRTKCTSAAELADFTAHGLGMALVYEDKATDWLGGYARGREAGTRARAHANQIGFPAGRPIYMAVDRDVVTAAEFATAVEYLRGAAESLGGVHLTGVYGEYDMCVRAQQAGVATWFWQTRAWSGTPVRLVAGRHLYQRVGTVRVGGINCDINDVLQLDWGQHSMEDDVSWNEPLTFDPPGEDEQPRTYNAATWLMWTNWYANMIPGLVEAMQALQAKVEAPAPVELTDAQLETLADKVAARLGTLRFDAEPEA